MLKIRIADSLPSGHIIHQIVTSTFMQEVQRRTGGTIEFLHFPGEQLGKAKDLLALTRAGVADIGYVAPSYQSDKMPLSSAFELPGMLPDYCQGNRALWAMTHGGGHLETHEFRRNGIVPIITFALPPYQLLLSSDKPIKSLEDAKGLKIRSAGGAMDFTVKSLGMVPVRLAPPEVYESMARGTIDGAIFPYQSAVSYGLVDLIKAGTTSRTFGTVVLTYSVGEERWLQLPESIRSTLLEAGEWTSLQACERFLSAEAESLEILQAHSMTPITFGELDDPALNRTFRTVAADWAGRLDRRQKPGNETLQAVRSALGHAAPATQ